MTVIWRKNQALLSGNLNLCLAKCRVGVIVPIWLEIEHCLSDGTEGFSLENQCGEGPPNDSLARFGVVLADSAGDRLAQSGMHMHRVSSPSSARPTKGIRASGTDSLPDPLELSEPQRTSDHDIGAFKSEIADIRSGGSNSDLDSVRAEARVDRKDANLVRSSELMEGPALEAMKPPEDSATSSISKAVARFEGTAAPGLRIWLNAEGSRGDGLHFLWLQTRGPEVHLEKTDAARVPILVPGNATELAFRLIVSGRSGMDQTSLDIPLELHARPSLPPLVVADAGDDQTGVVGHRITLNGIRSRPRERAVYRWIQVAGPAVSEPVEDAWIYSFVPTEPGMYRFVLVVAAEGLISAPDMVSVAVTAGPPAALAAQPELQRQNPIVGQARSRIRQIDDGLRYARELATAFEDVAKRASVYSSYEELSPRSREGSTPLLLPNRPIGRSGIVSFSFH